jgi:UDP-N-acetylmuramoylalanine-D-glutamate ligase
MKEATSSRVDASMTLTLLSAEHVTICELSSFQLAL